MAPIRRFGSFFRARRTALGLSLRDFCRRNGLDPGNISRLERGLLAPPKSADVLRTYAQALKLVPESEDWHRLFELAAADTGTIPSQVAEDRSVRDALPKMFRALRGTTRRLKPWVNAADLSQWADHIDAREQLPRLLRRLIHSAPVQIQRIEFAAGEGSQRRGWDGIVFADAAAPYVPAGLSVWEFGISADPASKAQKDFTSRTKNPLGVNPSETTYIFVTPRRWEGKAAWEQKKIELGTWKEVRVYDADTLEAWFELASAVDTWFARLLGKRTEGMVDADEYWNNLAGLTEPNLIPKVFLTSREDEVKALQKWLDGPPSSLAVEARSPAEVIDFFAAFLADQDEANRESRSSQVVIVEMKDAWEVLVDEAQPLILVAKAGLTLEPESVAKAVRNGHYVMLCSERFATGRSQTLILPRTCVYDLEEALKEAGFDEAEAHRRARDCSGSLTVLKRRLSLYPANTEPEWARSDLAADLAPLTLIGSWHDSSVSDQTAVELITGRTYSEIAQLVSRLSTYVDPPVIRVLGSWSLTSREDSWILLARHLSDDQLERWQELAIEVLQADDPRLDALPEERAWFSREDQNPKYSETLRTGIAESLEIVATLSEELGSLAGNAARVDHIVQSVLGRAPGLKRWASLGQQLPLIAEAAPEAFLSALEAELSSAESDIMEIFADRSDTLFSRCLHAGLLWALETLAWSPSLLCRVSIVLARLAERDPGRRWANRPAASLEEIFLPWLPHTVAGVEERIKVLRTVSERYPAAGWQLLLKLLPSLHGVSTPTHQPKWRDWAMQRPRGATTTEYNRQVEACAQRLLETVGNDLQRWGGLVEHISNLTPNQLNEAITLLRTIDLTAASVDQRRQLAEKVRTQVQRHRSFPDAQWALPTSVVSELEEALKHVEPSDAVMRNAWLFSNWPELPERHGEDWSVEKMEQAVARRRLEALREILAAGGMQDIIRLAQVVENPFAVGFELVNGEVISDDAQILPGMLVDAAPGNVTFARGYVAARFRSNAWSWVNALAVKTWSADQVASLALALPADRPTWSLVEEYGPDAASGYWKAVPYLFGLKDATDVEYAVAMLLRVDRPFVAIQALRMALHNNVTLTPELLMDTLDAASQSSAEQPVSDAGYGIQTLFQHLQSNSASSDEGRLAKLEWTYLRLLDGHPASPVTLHRALSTTPKFFADLLSLIFRSRGESPPSSEPPTEEQKGRASNGYRLLHSWHDIPGFDPEAETVDEEKLRVWVTEARALCREMNRLEVCDSHIGQLFAYAPSEPNGSWPCISVRDVIDEVATEDLVDGFVTGTLNKRGVYMKSPMEGGDQERDLEEQNNSFARACDSEWPTTASALRTIARSYARNARREDEEAEARRLGR